MEQALGQRLLCLLVRYRLDNLVILGVSVF